MAYNDNRALVLSNDIKTQLQPFYGKVDESSQLSDDLHRRYGLLDPERVPEYCECCSRC